MDNLLQKPPWNLHLGVALLLTACVALGPILYRFSRGLPVLLYEPRTAGRGV